MILQQVKIRQCVFCIPVKAPFIGTLDTRLKCPCQTRLPQKVSKQTESRPLSQEHFTNSPVIQWKYYGDKTPPGRPRELPSWSWAAAADGRIEWTISVSPDHIRILEPQGRAHIKAGESPVRKIKLQGLLLPFSIKVEYPSDSYTEKFPLARRCTIIEKDTRRHSTEQHLPVIGQHTRGSQVEITAKKTERSRRASNPKCPSESILSVDADKGHSQGGDFTADYIFWDSEKQLYDIMLYHVKFLFMGEKQYQDAQNDLRWINGLVLRPVYGMEQDVVYERVGWLSYIIEEQLQDWKPLRKPHTTLTLI